MRKNDGINNVNLPDQGGVRKRLAAKILGKDDSPDKNDLFQLVIEHLPDQIYLKARNAGRAVPEEIIGKTDFDFYPIETAERFLADENKVIKSADALINREEHYTDQLTSEVRWNLTTKIPIRDEANAVIGLLGINRDITDMKTALLEREQTLIDLQLRNRELEEFTHIVSHNLRAPVANILGLLAMVTDREPGTEEEVQPILENLAISAKKLDEIVHTLNKILETRQQPAIK
jgi:signal transduction histidine kinase